jgi:Chitin binding Peritrophin-A domain
VGNCKRLNGKWGVKDTCNQYIDCTSGVERLVTCQNHLVFDDKTGDCEHPDTANRQGCTAEELYGFTCPTTVGQGRYPAKDDYRAFFTVLSTPTIIPDSAAVLSILFSTLLSRSATSRKMFPAVKTTTKSEPLSL